MLTSLLSAACRYVFVQVVLYASITYSMIHFEWTAAKFFWCVHHSLPLTAVSRAFISKQQVQLMRAASAADDLPHAVRLLCAGICYSCS